MSNFRSLDTFTIILDSGEQIEIHKEISWEDEIKASQETTQQGQILEKLFLSIKSWNLKGSDDKVVKFSRDSWKSLSSRTMQEIIEKFTEWMNQKNEEEAEGLSESIEDKKKD